MLLLVAVIHHKELQNDPSCYSEDGVYDLDDSSLGSDDYVASCHDFDSG